MVGMKLLLFSGGLDSTALAWDLRPDVCLTVDYGQRPAAGEIRAAQSLCREMQLRHEVVRVDFSGLGLGPLAGKPSSGLAAAPEWWPYRNQMLITVAAMRFVADGLSEIIIGAVSTDVHADGKGPFLDAMDRVLLLQEGRVRLSAPARYTDPLELLSSSGIPRNLLGATFSCHVAEHPCGRCRGCEKHQQTMLAL
ncbi:UNVERIFIED_ORG: 7-cyano-7-deazaguanine synthase [Rhizobium pisi]